MGTTGKHQVIENAHFLQNILLGNNKISFIKPY